MRNLVFIFMVCAVFIMSGTSYYIAKQNNEYPLSDFNPDLGEYYAFFSFPPYYNEKLNLWLRPDNSFELKYFDSVYYGVWHTSADTLFLYDDDIGKREWNLFPENDDYPFTVGKTALKILMHGRMLDYTKISSFVLDCDIVDGDTLRVMSDDWSICGYLVPKLFYQFNEPMIRRYTTRSINKNIYPYLKRERNLDSMTVWVTRKDTVDGLTCRVFVRDSLQITYCLLTPRFMKKNIYDPYYIEQERQKAIRWMDTVPIGSHSVLTLVAPSYTDDDPFTNYETDNVIYIAPLDTSIWNNKKYRTEYPDSGRYEAMGGFYPIICE